MYQLVSSIMYSQIGTHFGAVHNMHSMDVGDVNIGYMDMVDKDEDRMFFDYYVLKDYYLQYSQTLNKD